eukprot:1502785-Heterocapsa_arctica.AAC.1
MLQKASQSSVAFASHDTEELRRQISLNTGQLAVVLSQGILSLPSVASAIVEATDAGLELVPITADP